MEQTVEDYVHNILDGLKGGGLQGFRELRLLLKFSDDPGPLALGRADVIIRPTLDFANLLVDG